MGKEAVAAGWERFFPLMCIILRSGGSRGGVRGGRAPPLFFDQNEARRAEKIFLETVPPPPSLISASGWPHPLPLSEGLDQPLLRNKTISKTTALRKQIFFPQFNVASYKRPRIRLSLEDTTTLLPVVGGRKESQWLGCLEKSSLSVQFNQEFCPRL